MKTYLFTLVYFLISSGALLSQNVLNTDRPDQSDGTHIVETNYFQFETGGQFSKFDEGVTGFDNVTLIRYGINIKNEVRLLNQYSTQTDGNGKISGLQPPTISFKNRLWVQNGLLPKVTLVSYFRLPITISPAFKGNHFGYTFNLAARHDLDSQTKIYSNLGITQDQITTEISYIGTLEINYNVTPNLGIFVEYFGNYAKATAATNGLDIGIIYAFKNNISIDLDFGSQTLDLNRNKLITFGTSFRIPK